MDMNSILNMVKDQVEKTITSESAIPEEKKDAAVDATTSSVVSTLKNSLGGGGLSSITSLLGGGGMSGIEGKVENAIESALTSKVGLKPALAQTVSTKVVTAVMKLLSSHGGGGEGAGLVGSLMSSFKG